MSTRWQENVRRLVQKYRAHGLTEEQVMEQLGLQQKSSARVEALATPSGADTLRLWVGGRWIYLHSRYNPEEEARRWVTRQADMIERHDVLLVYGVGLGYHVKELIRQFPDKKLFLYEPSPDVLRYCLHHVDIQDTLGHPNVIEVYFGDEHDGDLRFALCLQHIVYFYFYDYQFGFLYWPPYAQWKREEITNGLKKAKEFLGDYINNYKILRAYQETYLKSELQNFRWLLTTPPVTVFREELANRPAVLVASGPSMEEAVPVLREVMEHRRAYVFAAGTAIRALAHHGLVPDGVFSYDPYPQNYEALCDLLPYMEQHDIPLFFSSTIYGDIVNEFHGLKAHFVNNVDVVFDYFVGLPKAPLLVEDRATITAIALQVLLQLGAHPVVLVGQDLGYVDGRYYATGVGKLRRESINEEEREQALHAENNAGGQTPTNRSFLEMKDHLERVLRDHKLDVQVVYNTSRFGLKIAGTRYASLEEIVQRHFTQPVSPLPREKFTVEKPMYALRDVEKRKDELLRFEQKLGALQKAISRCEKDLRYMSLIGNDAYLRLLKAIRAVINSDVFQKLFYRGIHTYVDRYLSRDAQIHTLTDEQEKRKQTLENIQWLLPFMIRLHRLIVDNCSYLK